MPLKDKDYFIKFKDKFFQEWEKGNGLISIGNVSDCLGVSNTNIIRFLYKYKIEKRYILNQNKPYLYMDDYIKLERIIKEEK